MSAQVLADTTRKESVSVPWARVGASTLFCVFFHIATAKFFPIITKGKPNGHRAK